MEVIFGDPTLLMTAANWGQSDNKTSSTSQKKKRTPNKTQISPSNCNAKWAIKLS